MAKKTNKTHKMLKDAFLHRVNSNQYTLWREQAAYWWDFYDGEQLTEKERKVLRQRKQPDIIINLIAPKVDALAGTELEGRTIVTARERTFQAEDKVLATAFTRVALRVQEQNDVPTELSTMFKHSLIAGIGWSETTVEAGRLVTRHVDEFEMVWDTDDTSPQLKNQKYVFRQRWVDYDKAVAEFPAHKDALKQLKSDADKEGSSHSLAVNGGSSGGAGYDTNSSSDREPFSFFDRKQNKVLIVEGQYKKMGKKYRFINTEGVYVEVYDEAEANKMAKNKENIEVVNDWIVHVAFFVENTLLSNNPLEVQTNEFEYIPTVHKRASRTKIPYGVVKPAVDPQKEVNKRRQKALHLLNTRGAIVDPDVFENPERVREEISKPDFFLMKDAEGLIDIQDNLTLAESQTRVMHQSMTDIQSVTGIYDELVGQQSNATSGAAINQRQQASIRTKSFALDNFRMFKDRYGKFLMSYIQAHFTEQMLIILENGTEVILNGKTELNGEEVSVNNLQHLTFDIVVEQTREYDAAPEELAENLRNVAMNGQLQIIMQSPTLAKAFGIRNIETILDEMKQNSPSPQPVEGDAASEEANPAQTVPTIT